MCSSGTTTASTRRLHSRRRWPGRSGARVVFNDGLRGEREYDRRKVEARLNDLPNFVTEIDGLDIHFIHVRSKHEDALPLIVTHGWPGSVIEQLKIVGPLTDPTAHGGDASDAFHLVIPSIPATGSPASRRRPAGARSTLRVPGSS